MAKIPGGLRGKDNRMARMVTDLTESSIKGFIHVLMRIPGIGRHPWFRAESSDMRWLPINQNIIMPANAPMPPAILDRLIEDASHRVIIDYCGCREGFRCEHYPADLGCLMLGDSAIEIKNYPVREVGVEEAWAHARRAVKLGLVPAVGKTRVDNSIYRIRDVGRLITVCFCCDCCCLTRFAHAGPLDLVEATFPRLEGINLTVTDKCRGCGKCAEGCYIHAVRVENGRAWLSERCRACGRCASFCPSHAIEVRMDDPDFYEKTIERIRSYVKYD
jgi:ferredoxin